MIDIFSRKKMLITSPVPSEYDKRKNNPFLSYLFEWTKELKEHAENKNINLRRFEGVEVNRKNVAKYIEKGNPRLIMFCGHGEVDRIKGQNEEDIIISNENDKLLNSKIVYSLSCFTSKELGKVATDRSIHKNPCEAFVGYRDKVGLWDTKDYNYSETPLENEYTEPFKKFFNSIIISILNGSSVKESVEKTKQLTDELIEECEKKFPEMTFLDIGCLLRNGDILEFHGNPDAKV